MSKLFLKNVDKFTLSQMKWDEKYERVRRHYAPKTVRFMKRVEDAYADDDGSFRELWKILEFTINAKARKWASQTRSLRLSADDYASVMWEKAWHIVETYNPSETDWLLFETMRVALDRAAITLYHYARNGQNTFERSTVELKEKNEPGYIVTDAIDDRLMVEAILSSPALTDDEHATLRYIYTHPDDSYRDIALALGMASHTTLRRQLDRIKRKLQFDD